MATFFVTFGDVMLPIWSVGVGLWAPTQSRRLERYLEMHQLGQRTDTPTPPPPRSVFPIPHVGGLYARAWRLR